VVKYMNRDKAPGLNGFFMAFFQSCWYVIRVDVMEVFLEFFQCAEIGKSLNATFITLIPKKVGAVEVKGFRPISRVSGIYKVIVKVLANGLKTFENCFGEYHF
jgi:hypothetical protein